uniref:Uncharacterized protein n=1 Tax=Physcomitrium patens TaxID=3218 RepID=A0A2K1IGS3_PHYPA|nr:hypothetical protein PHYPA_029069 [Physcomitrium patens]
MLAPKVSKSRFHCTIPITIPVYNGAENPARIACAFFLAIFFSWAIARAFASCCRLLSARYKSTSWISSNNTSQILN